MAYVNPDRGNTTSNPPGRSTSSSTRKTLVYNTVDRFNPYGASSLFPNAAETSLGLSSPQLSTTPNPGLSTPATAKSFLPVFNSGATSSGVSSFAQPTKLLQLQNTPYGPASPDKNYTFINKKITIKVNGQQVTYSGYFIKSTVANNKGSGTGTGTGSSAGSASKGSYLPPGNPEEYEWNLPPHKWSLPTQPTVVNKAHYTESANPTTVTDPGSRKDTSPRELSSDKYRRGRLWWKANPDIEVITKDKKASKISAGSDNRKYGFQFLWNPETFGTQVAVQMEATPSPQDRFLGVAGAFPATETISFTIRIDRTNDFACAGNKLKRPTEVARTNDIAANYITSDAVSDFVKYYINNGSFNTGIGNTGGIQTKLVDLFQRGTIADIEYLYKAINGPGPSSKVFWTNGRGVKTADIGFLMPTLLHIDIGPLSYEGYVTNLSVNHIMFTPDMVPIRSDLTISLNLLATATLNTAG